MPSDAHSSARLSDEAGSPATWFICRLALTLTSLLCVIPALSWFNTLPPLGDDASSHIVLFARIADVISTGSGWWAPDFNLGFPIGLYYQPLPHLVGGFLTAIGGGGEAAIQVYKAVCVTLVGFYPWAVAYGARRIGIKLEGATAAGVVAPLVVSTLGFGLTLRSSLILALHTQAWAAVFLPLALGELARAIDGERRAIARSIAFWSLLSLCHFFYGVATAALAVVWLFCRPGHLKGRGLRTLIVSIGVGFSLAFWLIPLGSSLEAMGGWPFGSDYRVNGYGFESFTEALLAGQLLDGENGYPVLSIAAFTGFIACIVRVRASTAARVLLAMVLLTGLFTIGRAGLGGLVDLFPFNRSLQMFRYLGLFHLAAIWLIGWSVGEVIALGDQVERALGRGAHRFRQRGTGKAVALAILLVPLQYPVVSALGELRSAYRTYDEAGVDESQYRLLVRAMSREAEQQGAGRVFIHRRSGLYGHFHSALLALWGPNDAGESYGIGLHDSLNFYYLEFLHPEREDDDRLLDLYGFQYIAADEHVDFEEIGAEPVFASSDYTLWRLDHRVTACRPIDVTERLEGSPRSLRRAAREWLNGNGPVVGGHPLATIPAGFSSGETTAAPVTVDTVRMVESPEEPPGELLLDQRSSGAALCRVSMNRAGAVLFKTSYHPFWRATVDGQSAPISYAFPAFVAVEVGEGEHLVSIDYRQPGYVFPLFCLALLPTILAWWFGSKRGEGVGERVPSS